MKVNVLLLVAFCGFATCQEIGESRDYLCEQKSSRGVKTECRLRFGDNDDEFSAINDNGCFMNFDESRNDHVELCPLQCQRYNEAVIVKASNCEIGATIRVERRQSDWFMVRNGECKSMPLSVQFQCQYSPRVVAPEQKEQNNNLESIQNENDVMIEEKSNSIEDATSSSSSTSLPVETTTTVSTSFSEDGTIEEDDDDQLPAKVDTLLGFLFPAYRKAKQ